MLGQERPSGGLHSPASYACVDVRGHHPDGSHRNVCDSVSELERVRPRERVWLRVRERVSLCSCEIDREVSYERRSEWVYVLL